jgi:nucleoside-diphosphate-sugar epimerase
MEGLGQMDASKRLTTNPHPLKVLVVGATSGSGRAAVKSLLAQDHHVTALARTASSLQAEFALANTIDRDVNNAVDVDAAVQGQDAVIVTLGIAENPLRVRFFDPCRTARNIRSMGTRHIVSAMHRHGVRRLVFQSSYGVEQTRNLLGFLDRLIFNFILKPQIDDTEAQESVVRESPLDGVIAQPVPLTDTSTKATPHLWSAYLWKWTLWNHLRTAACIAVAILYAAASMGHGLPLSD